MADLIITPSLGKIDFIHQSAQAPRFESIILHEEDGLVFTGKISASSVTAPLNVINVTAGSSNANYPFIFASSGETGAKSLLMDSVGGTYNPSTNTATIDISGNSATTTLASNSTNLGGVGAASYVTLTDTQTLTNKTITGTFTGNLSGTSSWATNATNALTATNATQLNGQAASYYTNIPARLGYTPVDRAGDTVSGNLTVNGNFSVNGSFTAFSASNIYLSSSVLTIEDNILTLNAFSPYLRYAGIEMYDSGSGTLSQLLWDGEGDYFFLTGSTVNGKIITGPDAQANLTANFVPKATAGNKLGNSLIYDNGNVGIGTTNPIFKFQVVGSAYINNGTLYIDSGNTLTWGNSTQSILGTNDVGLSFTAGSATRMFISSSGNIGIGTTVTDARLHVNSTTAGATLLRTDGTNGTLFSVVDDLSDSLMSVNNSAGLPVLEVFADDRIVAGQYGQNDLVLINNKVGLGTNNPANKLYVSGSVSIGSGTYNISAPINGLIVEGKVGVGTNSVDSWAQLKVIGTSALGGIVYVTDKIQALSAFPGSATNLQLNTDGGNVGIGTTLPFAKLHVQGNISASSFTSSISNAVGFLGTSSWANNATTVVTNANLTGDVTSVGNVTTIANNAVTTAKILDANVTNAKLTNSSLTIGSTAIALGTTATTIAGLTSVTSTTFVGALTGTATTGSYANNLNAANQYTVGGITGSLFGTSSWATNALTANNVNNATLTVAAGTGISLSATPTFTANASVDKTITVTNSGVTSLTTNTGLSSNVTATGAVTVTNTGVTAITTNTGLSTNASATGAVTITNTGVTAITTNTGLSTNASATGAVTITNTGVTSNVAGTGISVSGATGAVTITNSGVTSAVAGTGVGVSAATGSVTFSIGQAVGTGNTPTFAGATLNGQLNVNHSVSTAIVRLWNAGSTVWSLGVNDTSGNYFNISADFGSLLINKTNGSIWISGSGINNTVLHNNSTLPAGNLSGTIPAGVLSNSSLFVGTSQIALNRASGAQTLNGVSIDGNAATSTIVNGTNGQLLFKDIRAIAPNNIAAGYLQFGFTTWTNTLNTSPYADYLHLRSYTDSSGGNDNLVMFRKDVIGMRIWQQSFGSATNYSTYKDVAFTDQIGNGTITIAAGTGVGVGTSNTFTTNQSGPTTVTISNTGVTSNVAGTGISVNNATGAVTITNSGVTSVAGTANQVSVSAGTGAVTFSLPQNIHTAATPTFAGLISTGNVGIGTTSPASRLQIGNLTSTQTSATETLSLGGTFSNTAGSNIKLRVYDDGSAVGGMSVSSGQMEINTWSAGKIAFYRGTTQTAIIDASGNVGIGTTSPTAKVESYQSSNAITFNYLATNLNNNSPIPVYGFDVTNGSGETRSIKAGIGYERHLTNGRGTMHFYNDSTNDTASLVGNRTTAGDIKMSLDNSGNLGIGTTTPATKLDVYGPVSLRGTTVLTTNFDLNAGNANDIYGNIRVLRGASLNDGMYIGYGGAGGNLKFFSNSGTTEFMTVATTGNVGIGSTSPIALLNIRASAPTTTGTVPTGTNVLIDSNTSNYLTFRNTGDNGTYAGLIFLDNNIGGYIAFRNYTGDGVVAGSDCMIYGSFQDHIFQNGYVNENLYNRTETMRIKQNGNVGIGSNNPQTKLDVNGILAFGGVAVLNTANNANDIYANVRVIRNTSSTSADGMYINYDSAGTTAAHLRFYANAGNERMRIQANDGNVGIGTTSAGRKLDVEGIVRTRGASGTGGFEIGVASTGAARWRIEWDSASDSLDFNYVA